MLVVVSSAKKAIRSLLCLISILFILQPSFAQPKGEEKITSSPEIIIPAGPFIADCQVTMKSCSAWADFRRRHPYPYQSILVQHLDGGTIAILITEPSQPLNRDEFDELVRAAFGKDLLKLERRRWMIGIDGWLEDVVLEVKAPTTQGTDIVDAIANDPIYRDRIALLQHLLFGTTFGAPLETTKDQPMKGKAANLSVLPHEIRKWLLDDAVRWRPISDLAVSGLPWQTISTTGKQGTFLSNDGSLILLAVPKALLASIRQSPAAAQALRTTFREFAVSSDAIVGGVWERNGMIGIIGRGRLNSHRASPPLRFETFALLAAQTDASLAQSYERGMPLAGWFPYNDDQKRDWAPIYLSPDLIDTEFGALLNITDQMLKSWSEAGRIEYVYFDYPAKPNTFPFATALSDLLREKYGSTKTLFNWNTSGASTVVTAGGISILTTGKTGALPVTYGSELGGEDDRESEGGDDMKTGHLLQHEQRAFDYFAGLRDPNLARVVQYTMLYQILINAQADELSSLPPAAAKAHPLAAGYKTLSTEMDDIFSSIRDSTEEEIAPLRNALNEALGPGMSTKKLAEIVADPNGYSANIQRRIQIHHARINKYNDAVEKYNKTVVEMKKLIGKPTISAQSIKDIQLVSQLETISKLKSSIEKLENEINAGEEYLKPILTTIKSSSKFGNIFSDFLGGEDIDRNIILTKFIQANERTPEGSIKTPSAVVSWNTKTTGIGGHNLDARALRFEEVPNLPGIALVETPSGTVLRYPPAMRNKIMANAPEISRAVEHNQVKDIASLTNLAGHLPPPRPIRAALELPDAAGNVEAAVSRWSGPMTRARTTKADELISRLQATAEKNACCDYIVRDPDSGVSLVAQPHPTPPPIAKIIEFGDTPSLRLYLAKNVQDRKARPKVMLETSAAEAQALFQGLENPSSQQGFLNTFAKWLGVRSAGGKGERAFLRTRDLDGRDGVLEMVAKTTEEAISASQLAQSAPKWSSTSVQRLPDASIATLPADLAGWGGGGKPPGILVSFPKDAGDGPPIQLMIIAKADPAKAASVQDRLLLTHAAAQAKAKTSNGTIAEYILTIKAALTGQDENTIKQLLFIIERDKERIHYAELSTTSELIKAA